PMLIALSLSLSLSLSKAKLQDYFFHVILVPLDPRKKGSNAILTTSKSQSARVNAIPQFCGVLLDLFKNLLDAL
ncbi:hypothetical protein IE53DRAFT_383058, partial [Violaceomyces palustris]